MSLGNPLPAVPPEVMTPSARRYLLATALYCVFMGLALIFLQDRFQSASFTSIAAIPPGGLNTWGVCHIAVGLLAVSAGWRGHHFLARLALIFAASLVGTWDVCFWLAYSHDPKASISGPLAYAFVTYIHMLQSRQPLRIPFDPILRAVGVRDQ